MQPAMSERKHREQRRRQAAADKELALLDRVIVQQQAIRHMADVLAELQDSASYWSEYDVPCGIHARIAEALAAGLAQLPPDMRPEQC